MRLPAKMLLVAGFCALATVGSAQQPPAKEKDRPGARPEGRPGDRPEGRPGDRGPGRGMQPGQILPPFLQDQLKLTDDQKKQLAELQKETDEKLAKLLTDDQKKQLKEMKERGPGDRRPGGDRPGGERRPGGDRPGGDRGPEKKDKQ
jgi:hypothetical protein